MGQQITVKAAGTLAGRMAEKPGKKVETGMDELRHAFPSAETLAGLGENVGEALGLLGIISSRAKAISGLAELFSSKPYGLGFCTDSEKEMGRLIEIPGIGPWTAKYIAMRGLGLTYAFLDTDLGIKKALDNGTPKELRALSEKWMPWRSYATMALCGSL